MMEHRYTQLAAHACGIARDSAANLREFLAEGSQLAYLAVQQCERELDLAEREIDNGVPEAITRAGEAKVREMLAALKFITDLERIGDLLLWVANRARQTELSADDVERIVAMVSVLDKMLEHADRAYAKRDIEAATHRHASRPPA